MVLVEELLEVATFLRFGNQHDANLIEQLLIRLGGRIGGSFPHFHAGDGGKVRD